jgi:hypothetical protein
MLCCRPLIATLPLRKGVPWVEVVMALDPLSFLSTVVFPCSPLSPMSTNPLRLSLAKVVTTNILVRLTQLASNIAKFSRQEPHGRSMGLLSVASL